MKWIEEDIMTMDKTEQAASQQSAEKEVFLKEERIFQKRIEKHIDEMRWL